MEKSEQILLNNINESDLQFIFHEKPELWQELLNAVNEALGLTPVIKSVCDCCKKEIDERTKRCPHCLSIYKTVL